MGEGEDFVASRSHPDDLDSQLLALAVNSVSVLITENEDDDVVTMTVTVTAKLSFGFASWPAGVLRGLNLHSFVAAGSLAEHELAEKRRKQLRVRGLDWIYLVANRVYFSKAYSVLYVVMIVLNLIMLIWLAVKGTEQESAAFVLFEGLITLILGIEVVGRMLTQGRKYWKRWSNWFELIVLVLCIGTVLMAHTTNHVSTSEEMDELLSTVLLVARYVLQGLRLLALLRHRKRLQELKPSHSADMSYDAQRTSSLGIIDFDLVDEDEADPLHSDDFMRESLDFDALVASADRHARSRDEDRPSVEMGILGRA
ncbi:Hypothetical Protein FCC1311_001892 [Hondaea fermentalgiana]|uniref:Ion transport domain-containing protein n=1 Tax=Hondaea fermentalgiana TaxID=2315210 RepID=A0A2R5FZ16_9STRA|nr:Hypothetical Protein FCC1311_001892 [Hondaea fermentalgiana]|eukprot:GBG23970.1 Hypothetical Protein FCC1311_001892 [Hondaea fermentalgiana]